MYIYTYIQNKTNHKCKCKFGCRKENSNQNGNRDKC